MSTTLAKWGQKIQKVFPLMITGFTFIAVILLNPLQTVKADSTNTYVKTFKITGYYSPLPGQKRYSTGSYQTDITLNGRGIAGADGTPVYYGMVAAPYTYSYGTKLFIPGIGTCAVHDRGGAIVDASQTGSYDRLDIWMGYGDEGLDRALRWGMRTVDVTVFGIDDSIVEEVNFTNYPDSKGYETTVTWAPTNIDNVISLQNDLKILGYLTQENVNGNYDEKTRAAVFNFQKDFGILDNITAYGAGYFGPRTSKKIAEIVAEREGEILKNMPGINLGKGSALEDVKKLQYFLMLLGYLDNVTEIYDNKTVEAVYQFQMDNGVVQNEYDLGAGYFGPETLARLEAQILQLPGIPDVIFNENDKFDDNGEFNEPENVYFTQNLSIGQQNEEVKKLQEELIKLNFLKIEPTGYFGEVTKHAVFKFQQYLGLLLDENEPGAGEFGPKTMAALNKIVDERNKVMHAVAEKK